MSFITEEDVIQYSTSIGCESDLEWYLVNILNLPNWTIQSVEEKEDSLRITADYTIVTSPCPACGTFLPAYRFGKLEQLFLDTPMYGKHIGILVQRQRYRCRECRKTFVQALPDMDTKRFMTKRLLDYIEQRTLTQTFTSIAHDVGIVEGTVRAIFREQSERNAHQFQIVTPRWLGIDELYLLGTPRCILANVQERTVVDLLASRSQQAVVKWLRQVPHPEQIEAVCMDMWQPYKLAVREVLPHATIVIDRFHVVKMANQAVEQVRKDMRQSLSDRQRRTLMHDRYLLLKRKRDLTEKDILLLETWKANLPVLAAAYDHKEAFYDVWEASTYDDALKRYFAWQEQTPQEIRFAFTSIALTVETWGDEIFAAFHFAGAVTNAYVESLNGLAKIANRLGRGYSFEAIRAKVLYSHGLQKQKRATYRAEWKEETQDDVETMHPQETYGTDVSTLSNQLMAGMLENISTS